MYNINWVHTVELTTSDKGLAVGTLSKNLVFLDGLPSGTNLADWVKGGSVLLCRKRG